LNIFKLLCTQEPPHRSSRAIQQILQFFLVFEDTDVKLVICSEFVRNSDQSFGIRTNRSEFGPIVRTNRSEFGPIVRDSDQSIGIRTSRSEFGPIAKIRTNHSFVCRSTFVVRSSFYVRRSFVVFRPPTLVHFLTALHTRTSTSEQHCSSSILKVFLNIPDSKIPWNGITVGYFRLFSSTYQIIRRNSVEWYYRRMTFRFPLAEH
jgi:hypothetical protein